MPRITLLVPHLSCTDNFYYPSDNRSPSPNRRYGPDQNALAHRKDTLPGENPCAACPPLSPGTYLPEYFITPSHQNPPSQV